MKGVSQVLTSTLVLAVAISVAGVYSNWAPDFAEDITGETADQTNQDIRCGNAGLTISSAEYDKSGRFTDVELRNSGTINLNEVDTVAFNDSEIVGQTSIQSIGADESRQIRIDGQEIPSRIAASSSDCPQDVVASTEVVEVTE